METRCLSPSCSTWAEVDLQVNGFPAKVTHALTHTPTQHSSDLLLLLLFVLNLAHHATTTLTTATTTTTTPLPTTTWPTNKQASKARGRPAGGAEVLISITDGFQMPSPCPSPATRRVASPPCLPRFLNRHYRHSQLPRVAKLT
ncbi:hypothetical protein E2C01_004400 [Portunus trituberculatus]|uniref:Uncharacterized protein n=1 Tax=Portunus trituberculatus TaxID=210409 RepID=A0A5B7CSW4_PORTR|nr:hypothetical protein [Portunus trituberculatus]